MQFDLIHIPSNTPFADYVKDHPLTFYAKGDTGELVVEHFDPATVVPFVLADGRLGFQDRVADQYHVDIEFCFMPQADWAVVVTGLGPIDHLVRTAQTLVTEGNASAFTVPRNDPDLCKPFNAVAQFNLTERPPLPWNNGEPALGWATCICTTHHIPDGNADGAVQVLLSQILQELQAGIVSCCQNALHPYRDITGITMVWATPKDAANPTPEEGAWAFVYLK